MTDWLAAGVVWGLVLFSFWRGYHKDHHINRFVVLTWSIFVSIALVFTLRIESVGRIIDGWVNGHPVTYFLNATFTLTAAVLYAVSLGMVQDNSKPGIPLRPSHRGLINAAFGVAIALFLFIVGSFKAIISQDQAFHLMRFVLSVYLLALMFGMLIPLNWWMFRREQVFPMRCKHLALIAGLCVYASGAMIAVLLIPPHLLAGQTHSDYAADLRGVLGSLCLLVILIPHRWIVLVLLPRKLRLYRRIARVERWITARVAASQVVFDWRQAFSPLYVDHTIYLTVINIMDHYREIPSDDAQGQAVAGQIRTLWPQNPRYDDLVKALSQVTL